MIIVLLTLLFVSIFLEATVISLPLVFLYLLLFIVFKRNADVFPLAFFTGLILDIVTVRQTGSSSLFFLVFFLMVLLYQRKYEISSYPFVAVSSFVGAYLYLLVFNKSVTLWQPVICSAIAVSLFAISQISELRSRN